MFKLFGKRTLVLLTLFLLVTTGAYTSDPGSDLLVRGGGGGHGRLNERGAGHHPGELNHPRAANRAFENGVEAGAAVGGAGVVGGVGGYIDTTPVVPVETVQPVYVPPPVYVPQ